MQGNSGTSSAFMRPLRAKKHHSLPHRSLDPQRHRYAVWLRLARALPDRCHLGSRLTKMQRGGHMQYAETKGLGEEIG
jgi:hypothetical protein